MKENGSRTWWHMPEYRQMLKWCICLCIWACFFFYCVSVCVYQLTHFPSSWGHHCCLPVYWWISLGKKKINHSSVILYLLLCTKTIFTLSLMRFHLSLFITWTLVVLTGCWCRLSFAGKAEEWRMWRRSPWCLFDNPGLQEPTVESSTSVWDQKSSFVLFWYPKKKVTTC